MKLHYDARNDHIYCTHAYDCKDILKEMGFRWNSIGKAWFINRPKNNVELGNMVCDLYINCKMDYFDLYDFLSLHLPTEISATIAMDEEHTARFQAATENI